jgi:hypothetical protein
MKNTEPADVFYYVVVTFAVLVVSLWIAAIIVNLIALFLK